MAAPSSEQKSFKVDARTILTLGRESIKDHATALLELVKNSWDADATVVEIDLKSKGKDRYIRIIDNGCGMTEEDVDDNWLRIGFSEKRKRRTTKRHRRKTGEKGIGRISADRLGAILELRTRSRGASAFGLRVDWDDFDVDGRDLGSIPISVFDNATFTPAKTLAQGSADPTGTELTIRKLRQQWTSQDIAMLHNELSFLMPPFEAVKDFEIYLNNDVDEQFNGLVSSAFYGAAEIELTARLRAGKIYYRIIDRIGGQKQRKHASRIEWAQLIQRMNKDGDATPKQPRTGPVRVSLLFYPRKADFLEGTELRLSDLREFLDRNAGVRIYRDNIRVRPYGDPLEASGDWLGLAERRTREPAGIARPTYKVAANQIVGGVFIGRDDNPHLVDSASREGLIEGDAFRDLRAFVLGVLILLEAHRHEAYQELRNTKPVHRPTDNVQILQDELTTLRDDLRRIEETVPRSAGRPVSRALDQVLKVATQIKATQSSIDEMLSQAGVLRGLATLGIATSVFGHETQSALSEFISATYAASTLLQRPGQPSLSAALEEIEKAKKYAEQVNAWGAFALSRVKRDKRTRRQVRVDELVEEIVEGVRKPFEAASVDVEDGLEEVTARTFPMDVETVVVNLLANAYMATQQKRRPRKVVVRLRPRVREGKDGFELTVSDTGPGVPKELMEKIWRPLFTTRKDQQGRDVGTGLGLTIVDSIVNEFGGTRSVDEDPKLGGARFSIWLPAA